MNRCFEVSYFGMDQLHHQETHTFDPGALNDLIADLEGRGAQMICVEADGRSVYEDGAFMSDFIQGKKTPPKRGNGVLLGQAASFLARATSMESPPWLRMSRPVSGMSPDVDCETEIFLAMSSRQADCAESM